MDEQTPPKPRPLAACGVMAAFGLATAVALAVLVYAVAVGLRSATRTGVPAAPPAKAR